MVLTHGIQAIYSSPLKIGEGRTVGVLNLYVDEPPALDDAAKHLVAQLVTVAAVAITATLRNHEDVTLADQLQAALSTRAVIDQGIGVIVATRRLTPTDAFTVLRKQSQNSNTRLAVIAQQLVDSYSRAA